MKEGPLKPLFEELAPHYGAFLHRNHVGSHALPGGRRITTGLGKGSGDLIGGVSVTITPDMVGQTVLIFLSVEVKHPGWKEPKTPDKTRQGQIEYAADINARGGRAGVATCIEEAIAIIKGRHAK